MSFYIHKAQILMVGLDTAGKTTIMYRLKFNMTVTTIPTIGYNVETVEPARNVSFTVWDMGGQTNIRPLWRDHFTDKDGLLFVVDSTDPERFDEARSELEAIFENDEMKGVPVVVLANKQDLPGARRPSELVEQLGLRKLLGHEWHVQGCCATNGEGLTEGFQKLSKMIKQRKKTTSF